MLAWTPAYVTISAALPAGAEAHFLSSAQERALGQRMVEEFEKKNPSEYNPILDKIQRKLIQANPHDLWFYENRGNAKRWVERIKFADTPENYINAVTYPGGFIYVYDGEMDFQSLRVTDGSDYSTKRPWEEKNIYQMASLAHVIGHEHSHWAHEDALKQDDNNRWWGIFGALIPGVNIWATLANISGAKLLAMFSNRQLSFDVEREADASGILYVENVPEYSIGGAAIWMYRDVNDSVRRGTSGKTDWFQPHSKSEKRLERALNYMKDCSNGFIRWEGLNVYVHGQDWSDNAFNGRDDVDYKDRLFFVMGQLATTIKFRTCALSNLRFYREDEYFPGGSRNKTVVVMDGSSALPGGKRISKVMDTFWVPKDELMAWDKKIARGIDPEKELNRGLLRSELVSYSNLRYAVKMYDQNSFHYMVRRTNAAE